MKRNNNLRTYVAPKVKFVNAGARRTLCTSPSGYSSDNIESMEYDENELDGDSLFN